MESGQNYISSERKGIKYNLTQKLINNLFLKWISTKNNYNHVKQLIEECKKQSISLSTPSPIFLTKSNPLTTSQSGSFIPPVSPNSKSANLNNSINKGISDKQLPSVQEPTTPKKNKEEEKSNLTIQQKPSSKINKIPNLLNFTNKNPEQIEKEEAFIKSVFKGGSINLEDFNAITTNLLEFPKMLNKLIFSKIDQEKTNQLAQSKYMKFHQENFVGVNPTKKYFNLLKSENNCITKEDLIPLLNLLLELHKGLEFLKDHPDFQDKYRDAVIVRILYSCDLDNDGMLSFREFQKSNLVDAIKKVCTEVDINKVREYFSYEHFYVLCCRFWELDNNKQNFAIDKEDFSKYDGHSLSRKAIDRIFNQVPRKFKSTVKDKMNFEDFIIFMLSEEDKTNPRSIEYWFKVVDLDSNGIITPFEMNYFYEEQIHRMEYLGHESVNFADLICQMSDMIKPEKEYQFTIKNLLVNRNYASIFFNSLLNLNKFLAYEARDPNSKTEIDKNPDYSDWDKFAYYEYNRLVEGEAEENDGEEDDLFDADERNQVDSDDLLASSESGVER